MRDVPKIVRERLRATPALNHPHPDADVLTAFAERSLTERERAGVLEHLAQCGDCRDIVALAVPAAEDMAQPQPAFKPSPRWLTWPALRWGFVSVGIIAIASVGFVRYKHSREGATVAYRAPAPQPASETKSEPRSATAPASSAEAGKPAESRERESAAPGVANKIAAGESPLPSVSIAPSANSGRAISAPAPLQRFQHGPKMAMQWQQQHAVQGAPQSAAKQQVSDEASAQAVPSASEMVEVQNQAVQVEAQAAPPASTGYDSLSANVARAKPATQPVPSAPVGGPSIGGTMSVSARWTISSSGGLERSYDQGRTWQPVDVNGAQGRMDAARAMANAKEADLSDRALKKASAGSIVFRAVAANGAEVWAGGSNGALYHTIDAGNHWTRVVPGAAGTTLTGDITSLEFPDSQHCTASTSTGEVWRTADGGQTWQRQ